MLEHALYDWISNYGYFVLFVLLMFGIFGLPVPDETLLTLVGYLIHKGYLLLIPTFCAVFFGSIFGITLSFVLGRTGGVLLLRKYRRFLHMNEDRIKRIHHWLERAGRWTLFFGYFVPGVRHVTAFTAGSYGLKYPAFAAFAYAGGFVWACTFISLGFIGGEKWEQWGKTAHLVILIVGAVAAVVVGGSVYYFRKRKNAEK